MIFDVISLSSYAAAGGMYIYLDIYVIFIIKTIYIYIYRKIKTINNLK